MPLLGDCDMLPIDVFNELFQHTTTARWNGNPDWTKPYRIATYRTKPYRTVPCAPTCEPRMKIQIESGNEGACAVRASVSQSVGSKFRFAGGQLDKQAVSWCTQADSQPASQPASISVILLIINDCCGCFKTLPIKCVGTCSLRPHTYVWDILGL